VTHHVLKGPDTTFTIPKLVHDFNNYVKLQNKKLNNNYRNNSLVGANSGITDVVNDTV